MYSGDGRFVCKIIIIMVTAKKCLSLQKVTFDIFIFVEC